MQEPSTGLNLTVWFFLFSVTALSLSLRLFPLWDASSLRPFGASPGRSLRYRSMLHRQRFSPPVCGSPPERSRGSSHLQTSFSRDLLAAPDAARSYHWAPGESLLHFSDRPVRLAAACCGHARLVWQRSMWWDSFRQRPEEMLCVCRWMAPPVLFRCMQPVKQSPSCLS